MIVYPLWNITNHEFTSIARFIHLLAEMNDDLKENEKEKLLKETS